MLPTINVKVSHQKHTTTDTCKKYNTHHPSLMTTWRYTYLQMLHGTYTRANQWLWYGNSSYECTQQIVSHINHCRNIAHAEHIHKSLLMYSDSDTGHSTSHEMLQQYHIISLNESPKSADKCCLLQVNCYDASKVSDLVGCQRTLYEKWMLSGVAVSVDRLTGCLSFVDTFA